MKTITHTDGAQPARKWPKYMCITISYIYAGLAGACLYASDNPWRNDFDAEWLAAGIQCAVQMFFMRFLANKFST